MDTDVLKNRFQAWDYAVFGCMLSVSALIGLYYGLVGKGQKTTSDFLLGGKEMGCFPVASSLIASFMSAITVLGYAVDVYQIDTMIWWIAWSFVLVMPVAAYIYLPVFYELEVTSAYEYLERRFNKTIRRCGSLVFIIQMTMYMSIVLYAPALALSQVTGLNVWGSVVAIGIVCTFYTTVGGMKAVMWTDAFQMIIMFGAMLTVVIKGSIDVGGFQFVWEKNIEGHRVQFEDFRVDPRIRHTFWSLTIGGFFTWIAIYGVNQAQVQRYLTTPTKQIAQRALWWNLPGLIFLLTICCYGGIVIYAKYWDCDPIASKQIEMSDQLLPLFVMDTLGTLPGLPGLFVAGIFSGALSTISSGMNSLAAVTLEDFVKSWCFPKLSEKMATLTSKLLALFYGILCIALVAVAEQLGNVLQAALSIFGIVGGPLLGVFTLGMFFPWANSLGAGIGLLVSFVLTFWIGFGAQIYKSQIPLHLSPRSTLGCSFHNNSETIISDTMTTTPSIENITSSAIENNDSAVLEVYKISYLWYSAIACGTVVIVGLIVSFMSGRQDPDKLDPRVISPLVRRFTCCFSKNNTKDRYNYPDGNYTSEYTTKDRFTIPKGNEVSMKEEKIGIENNAFHKSEPDGHFPPVLQSNGEYTTSL